FVIGKTRDFLQWFAIVIEILLLLRFIFSLIGANQSNIFADFLYALTNVILTPFSNLVNNPNIRGSSVFEWTTLIAMAIYALIFWLLMRFVRLLVSEPQEPVE
ncbi:MAG: YggT family protein, partial [Ktedonobacteraceae bacterium]